MEPWNFTYKYRWNKEKIGSTPLGTSWNLGGTQKKNPTFTAPKKSWHDYSAPIISKTY